MPPVFWQQMKHLYLKLINHSTHDHQKKEFKLAKACATEIRHLEHVCTTLEFKSRLMRRQPRDPTLGRSSASLLFPGPPVGMHQHNEQSHNNEPGGVAAMTNPQKTFSYTGDTSLPRKRLCQRREPAPITSRTWSENRRC